MKFIWEENVITIAKYILCFLVIFSISFAVSESSAMHEVFEDLDLNKDGNVDRNEFSESMKKDEFSKLDKDQNREITSEEMEGLYTGAELDKHRELYKRMDKDKNKRITFFEFSDYADRYLNIEEAFIGLDKDKNNSLEPDEINVRPVLKWITIRF
jgi:Ca2+-binding EF-hand superfamily protein